MTPASSAKLDALRLCAALLVVAAHASQLAYSGRYQGILEPLGRAGVVIFFALSGFVIAHVCETRHRSLNGYLAARLARLHSVFVPALLLTFLVDCIGRHLASELYAGYPAPRLTERLASLPLFVFFLFQSVGNGLRWLSNGPLWSIAYEFWYYAFFGVLHYLRGFRRWIGAILVAVIAGPHIAILFPLWISGVVAYRYSHLIARRSGASMGAAGIGGCLLLGLLCTPQAYSFTQPLRALGTTWIGANFSAFLLWDIVLLVPSLLLLVAATHPVALAPSPRTAGILARLANCTFAIYCFHVPLLLLVRATGLHDSSSGIATASAAIVVLLACAALGHPAERSKARWLDLWGTILRVNANIDRHGRRTVV